MRAFNDNEIDGYLACGESLDKAGAYSIQGKGGRLIASIQGDYLAAVGMPLKPIALYLRQRGLAFPLDIERFYAEKSFLNWRHFAR
jgi:septum formation protein